MLLRKGGAAGDQLLGCRPVQTHVALCGVHRLGHSHPVTEQVPPELTRGLPVDGGRRAWHILRARVGHDMRRRERDSALESLGMFCPVPRLGEFDLVPAAVGFWNGKGRGGCGHDANRSMVTRRPSAEDFRPASTSCKPRTPAARSYGWGRPASISDKNCSHWARKPLGNSALSGICSHWLRKSSVVGRSGFQTGIGVRTRGWMRQPKRPATAEPWVPSTWNSTSSPRSTRTAHDELTWATMSPSSSKIAYAASSAVAAYLRPCSSQRSGMWVTALAVTASTLPNRFSST